MKIRSKIKKDKGSIWRISSNLKLVSENVEVTNKCKASDELCNNLSSIILINNTIFFYDFVVMILQSDNGETVRLG